MMPKTINLQRPANAIVLSPCAMKENAYCVEEVLVECPSCADSLQARLEVRTGANSIGELCQEVQITLEKKRQREKADV